MLQVAPVTSNFGRKRSTPILSLGPAGPVVDQNAHVRKLLIKSYPSRAFYIIPETCNCLEPFCYLKILYHHSPALKSSGLISNQTCQAQATVTIYIAPLLFQGYSLYNIACWRIPSYTRQYTDLGIQAQVSLERASFRVNVL